MLAQIRVFALRCFSAWRERHAALFAAALATVVAGSAAQAQGTPQIPPPDSFNPTDANGVNLYSGSYSYTTPAISIGTPGQGGLSYSATFDTGVGEWRNSTAGMVVEQPFIGRPSLGLKYSVTVMGATALFLPDNGALSVVDGDGTLTRSGSDFTYTALDGSVAEFLGGVTYSPFVANKGLISSLTRPNGERLAFTYTTVMMTNGFEARRIQSVTNNFGYQIHFQYASNSWGTDWYRTLRVTVLNNAIDACAPTANTCAFSQTWPSLTFAQTATEKSVTDALGRTTRLLFPGGWLSGVRRATNSSGQNITLTRDLTGERTASISDGAGTWVYDYVPAPVLEPAPAVQTSTTTVRNPLAQSTVVTFTSTQVDFGVTDHRIMRVASVKNHLNQATNYLYSPEFRLFKTVYPEESAQQYSWNARGDLLSITGIAKPGSGLANTTVSVTLTPGCAANPALCGRPSSITDPRGNVTEYTYDAAGNLLTVTGPAPTPGAPRPQTRYQWEQRYAWYKQNGSSAITQAASPVWVQVGSSQCVTGATC